MKPAPPLDLIRDDPVVPADELNERGPLDGDAGTVAHPFTHTGLADRFARIHGDDARYVPQFGQWLQWDGCRWRRDESRNAFDWFSKIARKQADEVESVMRTTAAKLLGLRREMLSRAYRDGGAAIAQTMPMFTVRATALDAHPNLLNTPAGTIDLRNGETHPHDRRNLLTRCTTVSPDRRGIVGTRFAIFLDEITLGDSDLVDYLRRALGACLFGSNADAVSGDHWLLFLTGGGRNGKNTLIESVMHVMSDYGKAIPTDLLMSDNRGPRHPTEVANLLGVRLAVCSETEEGMRWAESKIKTLTGDAMLAARFMRQDFFEFPRSHRHVVYGNHRPLLSNPDLAMRSRLHIVPFNANFAGREDGSLPAVLRTEAGRILEWLISGAADYFEAGRLDRCAAVREESDEYFDSQATFDQWVSERTEPDQYSKTRSNDLYDDFSKWMQRRGEGVLSTKRWGIEFKKHFKHKTNQGGVGIVYHGVRLRPPECSTPFANDR